MRKRKLLEGFIDKTSITDLNKAKEQLSEGLERTEKDSGERTI